MAQDTPSWKLVWSDDFNGSSGSLPDASKWNMETGSGHNQELQYYTNRPENVSLDGQGHLVIHARKEEYQGRHYTSARLNTAGKFEQGYGRFEARIKIPTGQGIWPAFWMLGANLKHGVKWPDCGEIDIMENIGSRPTMNNFALHGPGYSGAHDINHEHYAPVRLSDDFHVYAAEWEPSAVRFYLDDVMTASFSTADIPNGYKWVYDHPFYLVLNVAVGGQFPGNPDHTTKFPQEMVVDYVRVYQR